MGTRSDIIVHRADGKWARVYCHWDGYLDHNGKILFEHYSSQERADALVEHGDMSSLGPRCDKPEGHSYENKVEDCTVYYGRDRGEEGTEANIGDTLKAVWPPADSWTEYTYVWDDGKWWVTAPEGQDKLVYLGDALDGKTPVEALVKVPFIGVVGKHA